MQADQPLTRENGLLVRWHVSDLPLVPLLSAGSWRATKAASSLARPAVRVAAGVWLPAANCDDGLENGSASGCGGGGWRWRAPRPDRARGGDPRDGGLGGLLLYDSRGMRRRRNATRALSAGLVVGVALLLTSSCGGGEFSTGCAADVDACAENEVCWPTTDGFACLPAPTSGGQQGAQCQNTLGRPSCAHGFVCYPPPSGAPNSPHQCSPRCDPPDKSPCLDAPDKICQMLRVNGVGEIGVCQP